MPSQSLAGSEQSIAARVERLPLSRWHVRMLSIVGLAHFFDAFDSLAIAFVLPVLVVAWHISPAEIGFMISAGYVGQMLGAIAFGWVAQRYGRRAALQWTIWIISVLSLACAGAWNYASLMVFRTLQGLGLGGEVPVAATFMNEISRADIRGRLVVLSQSVFALGIVVTSLVSIWIVPNLGWYWMFILGTVPAVMALFLRRLMPESPRWLASTGQAEKADKTMSEIEAKVARGSDLPPPKALASGASGAEPEVSWKTLFERRYLGRTLVLWILMACTSVVGYSLLTWMPTVYRTVFKLPLSQALQYGLVGSVASFLGVVAGAFVLDLVGRRPGFMIAFLGGAATLFLLWFIALDISPVYVMLLASLGIFFLSCLLAGLYLYAPELYPTRARALGTGVASAWLRIGSIVGPTIVGLILTGADIRAVFMFFALVGLVGAAVVLFFAIETRGRILEEISE